MSLHHQTAPLECFRAARDVSGRRKGPRHTVAAPDHDVFPVQPLLDPSLLCFADSIEHCEYMCAGRRSERDRVNVERDEGICFLRVYISAGVKLYYIGH